MIAENPGARQDARTTILVVENDGRLRSLARRVLAGRAYHVLEAATTEDALRIAVEQAGRIDLVVTDVDMPGTGARAMVGRLEDLNRSLRVLFVSGRSDAELLLRGFDKGYDPFLAKPFSGWELVAGVESALRAPVMQESSL